MTAHFPEPLAWTLIHFCWQAAAVAAFYRLVVFILARRSAQTRYLAALSSLLLMFALAAGTFAWEVRADWAPPITSAGTAQDWSAPVAAYAPGPAAPGRRSAQAESRRITLAYLLPRLTNLIDGLWLAGVLALTFRSLGGWWYLRRLRLASTIEPPTAVVAALERVSAGLGLTRRIVLRVTHAIDSPMSVGTLRAVVLLPLSAITSLGTDELEVVLAHELAHVQRADFFWNILQTIAETLFFFHPAVWWLSSRIRHERELCCDDLALTVCPNPVVYAHALYQLEEHRSRYLRLAMALDGHASRQTLLMRIARILGEPMTRVPSRRLRPFSLAAVVAGAAVLLTPVPQVLAKLAPAQQTLPTEVKTEIQVPVQVNAQANSLAHGVVSAQIKTSVNTGISAAQHAATNLNVSNHSADQLAMSIASAVSPQQSDAQSESTPKGSPTQPHTDYIDRMKAAGYDVDLDKLIAMKVQGVTPEYAREMANAGFGKLSADDLIACKVQGVNPETIAEMKKQGLEVNNVQDAISFRIFSVTPEFVSGMKAAGFDGLTSKELVNMRVQGVTPEYARTLKQKFPKVTAEDLVKARIFRIDDEFIAQAAKHGFSNLPFDKLVQLRISGLLDDESVKQ
ncbi:MAG TPA: M56 family metallopeptidase [Terracidiphilus sp.]